MAAFLFNKITGTDFFFFRKKRGWGRREENKGKGHMPGNLGIILRFLGIKL